MPMPHLWHHAAAKSAHAHLNQVRRDGTTPYAAHPGRVALTIAVVFGVTDETILAAAYLHDVIEDCNVDYDEVAGQFGGEVADLVAVMTKDMRLVEPEREKRYRQQLRDGPWQGRLIKLADVYDNLADAVGEASQRKTLGKAREIFTMTDGEEELAAARRHLGALIDAIVGDLESG
ncbi:MAG: HD domain-containing protein [Planctomycetes bacterium]|nr:HD domain-containing protein [Planctomycetota bacterium]